MLLFLLPALALAFILWNALTPSAGSNEMTWGVLNTVFGGALRDAMALLQGSVPTDEAVFEAARTVAHFCEYALLGLTAYLALRMNLEYIPNIAYLLFFGVMSALLDETLQGFTPGRAAEVADVRLDFYGFLAAVVLCLLVDRLICGDWVTHTYRKRHSFWR